VRFPRATRHILVPEPVELGQALVKNECRNTLITPRLYSGPPPATFLYKGVTRVTPDRLTAAYVGNTTRGSDQDRMEKTR
jgi:hypothetical protein